VKLSYLYIIAIATSYGIHPVSVRPRSPRFPELIKICNVIILFIDIDYCICDRGH